MSLYNMLMEWPRERVVKELCHQAKENAALRDRVFALEHEIFWLRATEPVPASSVSPP